jgi:hypothetical protein
MPGPGGGAPRRRVALVHWDRALAADAARRLRAAGFTVAVGAFGPATLRAWRARPPAAVVIDLSRGPMQGRDVGLAVRTFKATRGVALVFAGGAPEKVARVRASLPDAAYAAWPRVAAALRRAVARPPARPVVPASLLAGYSGTPLPRKLGIKPGAVVALVGAPADFAAILGPLPPGANLRRSARGPCGLALWFPRSRRDLEQRVARLKPLAAGGGLWIAWAKRASGIPSDLTQAAVRRVGLAAGLVDYKVCAIDATWTGLKFALRKPPAGRRARTPTRDSLPEPGPRR